MLKPINSIIKDSIGNIMFRGNVVTGTVATDNGDGSYDVFISESDKAYPKIFTLSRNPDLAVGDKVRILYKNGCKELPIILPPVKPSGVKNIYVVYKKNSDNKYYLIQINNDDSITEIAELAELYGHNLVRILTDNNGNVYALKEKESTLTYTWHKYNSSGVLQVSKVLDGSHELFGFIASNKYLYTMKANGDELYKRNLSNLEITETINLTSGHRFYYLCFDSDGYLYTYDRDYSGGAFIKWKNGIIDSHIQGLSSLSAWADFVLLGNLIAHDYLSGVYAATININLDSDLTYWAIDNMYQSVCGIASNNTFWYVIGENSANNKLIVEKYNSSKVLQSTIDISADYVGGGYVRFYNAITAYPF